MTTALTRQEQSDLRACEAVISKGINTFREVGKALAKIRDAKLYKAEYKSFEKYCDTRWGFSRVHAHRLIEAADVPEVLPNGNKIETEGAARRYLDEQKQATKQKPAEPKAEPRRTVVAEFDFDDDQDTSGGAGPVSSGPLAGMEPDSAGVSYPRTEPVSGDTDDCTEDAADDLPPDRIAWLLEQLDLLWSDYLATFRDDADWIHWRMSQESFAVKMGHE